jgi:hypothetical protein
MSFLRRVAPRATTLHERTLYNLRAIFGQICPVTRNGPPGYVQYMVSTLLVIGGVLVGLLVLLALIVSLSARPASTARRGADRGRAPSWVADAGRRHPDAWSPGTSPATSEIPAVR